MATISKIKIKDNQALRKQLDLLYDIKTQSELVQWSQALAKHILTAVGYDYENEIAISNGFFINRQRPIGKASTHDVRQAGFAVHTLAKNSSDLIQQAALRVAGQAISTGHMQEHAMVASDYAIKVMNLKFPDDMDAVRREREWQIVAMK